MKLPEDRASIEKSDRGLSNMSRVDIYSTQISDAPRRQSSHTYPETIRQEKPEGVSPGDQPWIRHPDEQLLEPEVGTSGGHQDVSLESTGYEPIEEFPGKLPGIRLVEPRLSPVDGPPGSTEYRPQVGETEYQSGGGLPVGAPMLLAGEHEYKPRPVEVGYRPSNGSLDAASINRARDPSYEETPREDVYIVEPREQWYTEKTEDKWYLKREDWYTETTVEQWSTERPSQQWYTERPEEQWYTERQGEGWYTQRSEESPYPRWSSEWEYPSSGEYSGYFNQGAVAETASASGSKPQDRAEDERGTFMRPGEVRARKYEAPPLHPSVTTEYGPGKCPPAHGREKLYRSWKEPREGYYESYSKCRKNRSGEKFSSDLLRSKISELRYLMRSGDRKRNRRLKGRSYRPGEAPTCGIRTATVCLEQKPKEDSQINEPDNRSDEEQHGSEISTQPEEPGHQPSLSEHPGENQSAKKHLIRPKEVRFQSSMYLGPPTTLLGLPSHRPKALFLGYRPRNGPPTPILASRTRATGFSPMEGLPGGPIGSRPSERKYRAKPDEILHSSSEAITFEAEHKHSVQTDVPVAVPGGPDHRLEEDAPGGSLSLQPCEPANGRRSDGPVGPPGEEPQHAESDEPIHRSTSGEIEYNLRERYNETVYNLIAQLEEPSWRPKALSRNRLREGTQIGTSGARPGEPKYRPKSDKPGYRAGEGRPFGLSSVRPGELKYRPRSGVLGYRPREGPLDEAQTTRPGGSR